MAFLGRSRKRTRIFRKVIYSRVGNLEAQQHLSGYKLSTKWTRRATIRNFIIVYLVYLVEGSTFKGCSCSSCNTGPRRAQQNVQHFQHIQAMPSMSSMRIMPVLKQDHNPIGDLNHSVTGFNPAPASLLHPRSSLSSYPHSHNSHCQIVKCHPWTAHRQSPSAAIITFDPREDSQQARWLGSRQKACWSYQPYLSPTVFLPSV